MLHYKREWKLGVWILSGAYLLRLMPLMPGPHVPYLSSFLRILGLVGTQVFFSSTMLGCFVIGLLPLICIINRVQHRDAQTHYRETVIACICLSLIGAAGLNSSHIFRRMACARIAAHGGELTNALRMCKDAEGAYPQSLRQLVPEFIGEIPDTGIMGHSEFNYFTVEDHDHYPSGYVLEVDMSWGALKFDWFYYVPTEEYPEYFASQPVERIENWAYVHE